MLKKTLIVCTNIFSPRFLLLKKNKKKKKKNSMSRGQPIRHNSEDSEPTSNLVCIKMASILNYQSRDCKHGDNFMNYCEITILLMKSPAR